MDDLAAKRLARSVGLYLASHESILRQASGLPF